MPSDCRTAKRPLRVLIVSAHPVQYATPIFRLLAKDSMAEIQVAYCSMQGAEKEIDRDFGVEVKWDIPLLEGYPWVLLRNHSWLPGEGSFWGFFNPGIWSTIARGQFDAVILFTGYVYSTFWIALAAAKWKSAAVIFGTDAHTLAPRDAKRWKVWLKRRVWPQLFQLADIVLTVSSGGAALMRSLGIPEQRISIVPFCVDNEWWARQSESIDRSKVRAKWSVPETSSIVLFCAKLQPWKRPEDLLRAFAKLAETDAYLVFAGEGPSRQSLEAQALSIGISDRVRFLGFVNQSGLPETYTASDILVLPSSYEPFGLVVNEAMLCGCPVIVSDRVGARFDLVRPGETGYIFPCGDVAALASALRDTLHDRAGLRRMGEAARKRMETWSHVDYARALMDAVSKAAGMRTKSA
jgi:glycosyltransferase involved in cell wall biosynthesis